MVMCFIGGLGMQEILLIVLVVLLFFGGKKIPEMMKGLGKGVKAFKDGLKDTDSDETSSGSNNTTGANNSGRDNHPGNIGQSNNMDDSGKGEEKK